MAGLPVSCSV
jgi:hypothetical protein